MRNSDHAGNELQWLQSDWDPKVEFARADRMLKDSVEETKISPTTYETLGYDLETLEHFYEYPDEICF